jgi:hypothetical protein
MDALATQYLEAVTFGSRGNITRINWDLLFQLGEMRRTLGRPLPREFIYLEHDESRGWLAHKENFSPTLFVSYWADIRRKVPKGMGNPSFQIWKETAKLYWPDPQQHALIDQMTPPHSLGAERARQDLLREAHGLTPGDEGDDLLAHHLIRPSYWSASLAETFMIRYCPDRLRDWYQMFDQVVEQTFLKLGA